MTFSNINVSNPNDGLGDKLRDAFIIVNDNFASIGTIVDAAYITATLSNYATKTYVDNIEADLQDQVDFINGRLNTNESDIDALQTDVTTLTLAVDGKASLTQLNNSIANVNDAIASQQIQIDGKIDDAPSDDKTYGRRNENWVEVSGGGSLPYKVYSAIVNQSGDGTSQDFDNGSGDLEIGRTYTIKNNDSDTADFTNVGAPNNNVDTNFVATGTTPTSWGNDGKATLSYIIGAPVMKVLQNTIGNITWYYSNTGDYRAFIYDNTNTAIPTFIDGKTPTLNYITGPYENNVMRTLVVTRFSDEELRFTQLNPDFNFVDDIYGAFIEIRVYN